jgi:predicted ribosomally synthesized peptide with SipW-like signal peptide
MSNTETVVNPSSLSEKKAKSKLMSRKVRAILAGGLVLGIGVGVTLAAWNDSEFARGTYTAGTFDLEGSVATGVFTQNPVGTPATLAYSLPALNLSPSDVTYAPFAVRLSSATTTGATVTMLSTATSGVVSNLTYTLVKTAAFACDATVISDAITAGGALVTNEALGFIIPNTVTFTLAKGTPTATPAVAGLEQNLCFAVTAGSGLVQGQTGTSTISFTATSTS